jgi:hypothetical protein
VWSPNFSTRYVGITGAAPPLAYSYALGEFYGHSRDQVSCNPADGGSRSDHSWDVGRCHSGVSLGLSGALLDATPSCKAPQVPVGN